jgi:ferredoxin
MVRASIDEGRCQGHGRCALIAPDVFDVDDLGKGAVLVGEVPAADLADVEEAALSCPEDAIRLAR